MAFGNKLPDLFRGEHPWGREMSRLQRRIDRMFDEAFFAPLSEAEESGFIPLCDVDESEKQYLISFDLPGVKMDEIKIELRGDQLIVSGERKREQKEEKKGRVSQERFYGSFVRSFALPPNVSAEKVEASYNNGVLQIAIPKSAEATAKQIPIKQAKAIEGKPEKAA